jgi:hypothetical protein
MLKSKIPRRIFGPKRQEEQEPGESCTMRSFMNAPFTKYN